MSSQDMSRQTPDLIAEGVSAFNAGDIAGMLAPFHPEIEFQPIRAVLDGNVYRGHDGFRRWLEDMAEDWTEFDLEVIDIQEPAPDRVLVHGWVHARARASGVEMHATGAWLCEMDEGLIRRLRFYKDVDTALEANRARGE
jgi:ketosteroid isomerase-like protein